MGGSPGLSPRDSPTSPRRESVKPRMSFGSPGPSGNNANRSKDVGDGPGRKVDKYNLKSALQAGMASAALQAIEDEASIDPADIVTLERRKSLMADDTEEHRMLSSIEITSKQGKTRKLALREQMIMRVLMRNPAHRTVEDIDLLTRATADVKFFGNLTKEQHREVCREMTHELVQPEVELFRQGDDGSVFYIIYRGGCKLYVTDPDLNWTRTCVGSLMDGDSFGELALLGNGHRNATAVTSTLTILFKVTRDAYKQTLQKLHEQDLHTVVTFLKGIHLFGDWKIEEVKRMASIMTRRRFGRNETIIRQGEQSDMLYFCMSGRCRIITQMTLTHDQHRLLRAPAAGLQEHSPTRTRVGEAAGGGTHAFGGGASRQPPSPQPSPRGAPSPRGSKGKSPRSSSRRRAAEGGASFAAASLDESPKVELLEIGELGAHEYFGELSMMQKGPHTASVVSLTPTEVLILSRHDFQLHMMHRCSAAMQAYADRTYVHSDRIVGEIQRQHEWDAYKSRVLNDAVTGRALTHTDECALDDTILELAGEGIAGSRLAAWTRERVSPRPSPGRSPGKSPRRRGSRAAGAAKHAASAAPPEARPKANGAVVSKSGLDINMSIVSGIPADHGASPQSHEASSPLTLPGLGKDSGGYSPLPTDAHVRSALSHELRSPFKEGRTGGSTSPERAERKSPRALRSGRKAAVTHHNIYAAPPSASPELGMIEFGTVHEVSSPYQAGTASGQLPPIR